LGHPVGLQNNRSSIQPFSHRGGSSIRDGQIWLFRALADCRAQSRNFDQLCADRKRLNAISGRSRHNRVLDETQLNACQTRTNHFPSILHRSQFAKKYNERAANATLFSRVTVSFLLPHAVNCGRFCFLAPSVCDFFCYSTRS